MFCGSNLPIAAVGYNKNLFRVQFFQVYVPPFNRFFVRSKTIDTEGCGSLQSCRIAAVLRRKGRKKSSQVKFPFFSVLLLALLGYCFEFCRPGRSKKYRCLCICAKTAFAISTPVSFLCSFSCSHLVAEGRQGAAFYGTALC